MKKYVYIFSNTERADLVKIGKTNNNPRTRARALSNETGAIGHFVVEWFMEVPDNDLAEKILFYKLRDNHYDKEFFKVGLNAAISTALLELCNFFEINEPAFFSKNNEYLDEIIFNINEAIIVLQLLYKKRPEEGNDAILQLEKEKDIFLSLIQSSNQIKDF